MRLFVPLCLITTLAASPAASPAAAQEVFVGAHKHAVDTPFTLHTGESGADLSVGFRFAPIVKDLAPYVVASINTRRDTSFAGAGLGWTLGKGRFYARPAVGLVVHDGPARRFAPNGRQTDLGSRVLFEPEIGIGWRAGNRLSIEANWMHISHARLFNRQQNPGIDMMGVRLNWRVR